MAAKALNISGMDEVLKNLNREIQKIEGRTQAGVQEAALLVMRESAIQCPVETGNLLGSAYTRKVVSVSGPAVELGYGDGAAYAPYVHEMVGANFTGPRPSAKSEARRKGGKPTAKAKFLEDPLKENTGRILQTIRRRAQIP